MRDFARQSSLTQAKALCNPRRKPGKAHQCPWTAGFRVGLGKGKRHVHHQRKALGPTIVPVANPTLQPHCGHLYELQDTRRSSVLAPFTGSQQETLRATLASFCVKERGALRASQVTACRQVLAEEGLKNTLHTLPPAPSLLSQDSCGPEWTTHTRQRVAYNRSWCQTVDV